MERIKALNVNHPGYSESLKAEKYNLIRGAILAALPEADGGESMSFAELETAVTKQLKEANVPSELFPKEGSVRWYTKSVQLDLEARKLIERLPKQSPIRLRKTASL